MTRQAGSRTRTRLLLAALCLTACAREPATVRVAASVPDRVARPLLREFAARHHAVVDPVRDGPELLWTADPEPVLRRAAAGELAPLPAVIAPRQPPLVDAQRRWAATDAIGRVIVFDPARLAEADAPSRVRDLARPESARRLVLADPSRGTGAWQAAALGAEEGVAFFRALRAGGARVVADEDAVVAALAAGEQPLALVDSDRAYAAQAAVPRLVITIPDQGEGDGGVFLLPSVVAVTTCGAANPAAAELAAFLLADPSALRMALDRNAFVVAGTAPAGLLDVAALKVWPVDYGALAERLPARRAALR